MPEFGLIVLHVADPAASAGFYADVFAPPVLEQSPGFAMLRLGEGATLGLWRRDAVEPPSAGAPGAAEIVFPMPDAAVVQALHARWLAGGMTIAQAPTRLSFGLAFVALDPDGHWVRVFAPGPAA